MICFHNVIFPSSPWARRSVSVRPARVGVPVCLGSRPSCHPGAQLQGERQEVASTPPAPSWPQMSLPQLQAANSDNEVIFLRNVHLENSPVCRPSQRLGYRSWEGRPRGEAGKVGTRRTARMGPLGVGGAVWGLPGAQLLPLPGPQAADGDRKAGAGSTAHRASGGRLKHGGSDCSCSPTHSGKHPGAQHH